MSKASKGGKHGHTVSPDQLNSQRKLTNEDVPKADKQVYVFIRFNTDVIQQMRNDCVKSQNIIRNYGGDIIGMADMVHVYERFANETDNQTWSEYPPKSVLVLRFRKKEDAILWCDSDPSFRQKLVDYETMIVPMRHIPPFDYRTFAFYEFKVRNNQEFSENYIEPATTLLDKLGVLHGVVVTDEVTPVRVGWDGWSGRKTNKQLVIHQFMSPDHFQDFYDEYPPLYEARQGLADTQMAVFTLQQDKLWTKNMENARK